jgi:flagellar hook-associated protein 2
MHFQLKKASSSDSEKLTATAGTTSLAGNHSFTVSRLATAHTVVSKQYSSAGTVLSSAISTDQSFSISVGHPTNDDSTNRVNISITVPASNFNNTSDETALTAIANAINSAMTTAVTNDTVESDEIVSASVVSEENGKSRLVLTSAQTGYTYRQNYNDTSGLLSSLGVSTSSQSSGVNGGYITSEDSLNSLFTMDGLSFSRDSNRVNDALTGVTFNLLQTFSSAETLTVVKDVESVKTSVNEFVKKYNDTIQFLRANGRLDPDTKVRGVLANDSLYSGLASRMQQITTKNLSGTTSSIYKSLSSIGITADSSGMLSISDSTKFESALNSATKNVSDVFNNSTDGIAAQLETLLESFTSASGSINASQQRLDDNILQINDQLSRYDERLERRRIQLTNEFAKMQELMASLARQQSFMGQFFR